jgi:hypothetical protein
VTERDLRALLRALGLSATADSLDDLIALATKKRWSPVELFEQVAIIEDKDRAQRGLERRLKRVSGARTPFLKAPSPDAIVAG